MTVRRMHEDDEPCDYCGDGDPVPAGRYWRCPTCDAEWNVDSEEEPFAKPDAQASEGEG